MNTYKYIIIAISLLSASTAYSQGLGSDAAANVSSDLIMGITPDGEVKFYKYVEPLRIPSEPTTEDPQAVIHYSSTSNLPSDNIYFAAQSMAINPEIFQSPQGFRPAPGTQGSYEPIPEGERKDMIENLAKYASEQAHEAAMSLCGIGSIRPESVSLTLGVAPLQATVGWSVDNACSTSQDGG